MASQEGMSSLPRSTSAQNNATRPLVGKAGRYTVFIKPPPLNANKSSATPSPNRSTPRRTKNVGSADLKVKSSANSFMAKVSDVIAKIQSVHSAIDEYLADWFGLNQSKYQWYVDEYLEMKKLEAECGKPFETLGKGIEMPTLREPIMKR